MKLNIKQSFLTAVVVVLAVGGVTTSCVGDLDVEPINPQQTMNLDKDALFNKIYGTFCLVGENGPGDREGADLGAIEELDIGQQTEFYRMQWYMNEFTSDEASWVWATDAGVPELLHNNYDARNGFAMGLYYRLTYNITLCNYFLANVSDAQMAAEVRFIRAVNYYYMMDMFGAGPFLTKVSAELAPYYNRQQLYDFVESELKDIEDNLSEPGENTYGRVDKVSAWMMLARLYLNAEVYTGEAKWQLAKEYAEKVINNGYYHLMETPGTNPTTGETYTPYQMLFLADNNTNGAQYETIFPLMLDGIKTQSYGSTNFLIFAAYSPEMSSNIPSGTDNHWGRCARTRGKLVEKFFGADDAPQSHVIKDITDAAGDDRALFYPEGFTKYVEDEMDASQGYGYVKFRNVRSDGQPTTALDFVDTDLPFLRIAEAYLTYAEAVTRLNGVNQDAASKINSLRKRAHATQNSSYTLEDIMDEWSREFWFEGRRRMDLIRFNCYAGQSEYKWNYMGGEAAGTAFPSFRSVYAIPQNDLDNNSNLKQNEGY